MTDELGRIKIPQIQGTLNTEVQANPEPSHEHCVLEGAETRRGVCIKCGVELTNSRQKKFCSLKCGNAYRSYASAIRHNRFAKPGVGSGGNQLGEDNHMYKNGIGMYSKVGFEVHGDVCNRCGAHAVLIHHIDHDRTNNDPDNLEPLCKACHQEHHTRRDKETGKYIKG